MGKDNLIRVVRKAPGEKPEIKMIPNTLDSLQHEVGGYIELVRPAGFGLGNCNMYVDEEGLLKQLPFNIAFGVIQIVGPIIVTKSIGDDEGSLTEAEAAEVVQVLTRG